MRRTENDFVLGAQHLAWMCAAYHELEWHHRLQPRVSFPQDKAAIIDFR